MCIVTELPENMKPIFIGKALKISLKNSANLFPYHRFKVMNGSKPFFLLRT